MVLKKQDRMQSFPPDHTTNSSSWEKKILSVFQLQKIFMERRFVRLKKCLSVRDWMRIKRIKAQWQVCFYLGWFLRILLTCLAKDRKWQKREWKKFYSKPSKENFRLVICPMTL